MFKQKGVDTSKKVCSTFCLLVIWSDIIFEMLKTYSLCKGNK